MLQRITVALGAASEWRPYVKTTAHGFDKPASIGTDCKTAAD
jgi:hypothetical protein